MKSSSLSCRVLSCARLEDVFSAIACWCRKVLKVCAWKKSPCWDLCIRERCGSVEKGIRALLEALLSRSRDVSGSAEDLELGVGASWGVSSRSQAVAGSSGDHRQMLLAETTREFSFLTWQRALPPAFMSASLRWPRFSLAPLEPGVLGLCRCPTSPALPRLLELVCQAQLWTSVNDHVFQ